jgi:endoglucanase
MITAHLDHPAFVVTAVYEKGQSAFLELEFRGGVATPYFKGAKLEVFDRSTKRSVNATITAVHDKKEHFQRVTAKLPLSSTARTIAPGSIARWKLPKATITRGIAHTHACDDLAAVAAALVAFDEIIKHPQCSNVSLLFTRAEEIGFIGAIGAARAKTIPKGARLLCLENSRSFPHDSPIGAGPIVRVGDKASVFSPELTNRVSDIAAAHAKKHPHFRYQRKLMPGGTCEATAFSAFGITSTCICLPLGNYHNMQKIDEVAAGKARARIGREFISTNDFHGLVELLEVVAIKLDDQSTAKKQKALMDTLWARHKGIVSR